MQKYKDEEHDLVFHWMREGARIALDMHAEGPSTQSARDKALDDHAAITLAERNTQSIANIFDRLEGIEGEPQNWIEEAQKGVEFRVLFMLVKQLVERLPEISFRDEYDPLAPRGELTQVGWLRVLSSLNGAIYILGPLESYAAIRDRRGRGSEPAEMREAFERQVRPRFRIAPESVVPLNHLLLITSTGDGLLIDFGSL
jgi:hypothetical protein